MLTKERASTTVKVDSKGRVTLPKEIRTILGVKLGDTVFLKADGHSVRLMRAVEDPLVILGEHAESEFRAGRTKNLREYMRERGIEE
ncbi:MAG: AbrB/MazE/SpoVT family DNA-binding domain-containing protein [Syntrophomonadaceae bacterium]|nr:AbrB/MazE/SpoVT family DNA-binding domain-containing protein [Syntrophomonadaceae bacterium]